MAALRLACQALQKPGCANHGSLEVYLFGSILASLRKPRRTTAGAAAAYAMQVQPAALCDNCSSFMDRIMTMSFCS